MEVKEPWEASRDTDSESKVCHSIRTRGKESINRTFLDP